MPCQKNYVKEFIFVIISQKKFHGRRRVDIVIPRIDLAQQTARK